MLAKRQSVFEKRFLNDRLNLAQISRKVKEADGGNDFLNAL